MQNANFFVDAIDNVDFNMQLTAAMDSSYLGTSISLHQHRTSTSEDRPLFEMSNQEYKVELPEYHTLFAPVEMGTNKFAI